ncbi:MAG: cellobiose phosphorylase, partial [Desulfobacterales bacterium]|nr:cellobiose phosphorylase [Desulfobacterales bacterium]
LVPFLDPETYGRSPLENSSFIVSSAHPDESLHGSGFTARLSGSSAEFLDIWRVMMAGQRPFFVANGQLYLALKPALPGWLFDDKGTVTFTFLGHTRVTYHNPAKVDTFRDGAQVRRVVLHPRDGQEIEFERGIIDPPYAEMVRAGRMDGIDVFFA